MQKYISFALFVLLYLINPFLMRHQELDKGHICFLKRFVWFDRWAMGLLIFVCTLNWSDMRGLTYKLIQIHFYIVYQTFVIQKDDIYESFIVSCSTPLYSIVSSIF